MDDRGEVAVWAVPLIPLAVLIVGLWLYTEFDAWRARRRRDQRGGTIDFIAIARRWRG